MTTVIIEPEETRIYIETVETAVIIEPVETRTYIETVDVATMYYFVSVQQVVPELKVVSDR